MSDLFASVVDNSSTGITMGTYVICLLSAFVCGIIVAVAASYKTNISKGFISALILLPAIVTTVIVMVNGNVGTGIAVAGAFSLVRFRSVAGRARDIACIFFAMTVGLVCAGGYVVISFLFSIIIAAAMILIGYIPLGEEKVMDLRITVPESLQFANEFDDLFEIYTKKSRLVRVKTANMGSLYKLFYKIEMKNTAQAQEFIDKLRCRNGNLEIAISESVEGSDEL